MGESIQELKEKLALACRVIINENLTDRGKGHQCVRVPGKEQIILPGHLHDVGRGLEGITADDMVIIDFNGKVLEGKYPESMGEFQFYVGEPGLGDRLARKLGKSGRAVIHRAHGVFVVGRSIEDCLLNAITLEKAAQFQVWATMMAKLKPFTKAQLKGFNPTVAEHIFAESFAYFANKVK